MLKKNGGITLIALVITIIVLLILAGVSIAMLTGNNGLLSRSTQAADKEVIAGAKDAITADVAAYGADWYEDKYVKNANPGSKIQYVSNKLVGNGSTITGDYSTTSTVQGCSVEAVTVYQAADSTTTEKGATIKIVKTGAVAGDSAALGTINSDGTIDWEWTTK